jgi:hypothetical protein
MGNVLPTLNTFAVATMMKRFVSFWGGEGREGRGGEGRGEESVCERERNVKIDGGVGGLFPRGKNGALSPLLPSFLGLFRVLTFLCPPTYIYIRIHGIYPL